LEYHEHCGTGHGGQLSVALHHLPPLPEPRRREDYPNVTWTSDEFAGTSINTSRGETDGDAFAKGAKPKLSHPCNNNTEQESKHPYLQNVDGSHVTRNTIAEMSKKA